MAGDAVQAKWQVAHVHLCKSAGVCLIARLLLITMALRVVGLSFTVSAPVVWIALRPRLLRGALVDPVVRIRLELGPLPFAFTGALAVR